MLHQELRSYLMTIFYVVFFIFFTHRLFFHTTGIYERLFSFCTYPVLNIHARFVNRMKAQDQDKKDRLQLQKELEVAQLEINFLKSEIVQYQAQQIFLEQTEELRQFAQHYNLENLVIAKVLMMQHSSTQDSMYINVGSRDSVQNNDIVIFCNTIIGRVIEVYSWYSKVALVTDKRCRIAARVGADCSGLMCGFNNNQMQLLFVPHYKKVERGQIIMSSGQGMVYPADFALGYVDHIQTDLVSHVISVKPIIDVATLEYVYVIKHRVHQEIVEPEPSGVIQEEA